MRRVVLAAIAAMFGAVLAIASASAAGASGSWHEAGTMAVEHNDHTATLLNDGTVLVAGGGGQDRSIATAEIYDPGANSWRPLPPMTGPRQGHAAVRLDDGRVLVAGGLEWNGPSPPAPLASAEVFDPDIHSRNWTRVGSMAVARIGPTLTVLPDGRVLVAGGGLGGDKATPAAELFDPVANRWSPARPMSTPRMEHAALLLNTGKVLVAGGIPATDGQDGSLATAELYDYRLNQWTAARPMPTGHAGAAAGVLGDGETLIAGGLTYQGGFGIGVATTDLYNPIRDTWTPAGSLRVPRGLAGGTLLSNGFFLVVGGTAARFGLQAGGTSEVFDPGARQWTLTARLHDQRSGETVTALSGGRALVVGGSRQQTAELFVFTPPTTPEDPRTLPAAVAHNLPLVLVSALLLAAVAVQAVWRRSRSV